jgi:hypothetical protein
MRWHYRDPLLVWLLPTAYACHLIEEWLGGLRLWISLVTGAPIPQAAFVAINGIAFALFLTAARRTTQRESAGWMGIAMATILLVNGSAHILGTLMFRSYSPGLVTSVILYLPLSQLLLLRAWYQAESGMLARGVVAGIALHALVAAIVALVTR